MPNPWIATLLSIGEKTVLSDGLWDSPQRRRERLEYERWLEFP
jgi:hypothetical protein